MQDLVEHYRQERDDARRRKEEAGREIARWQARYDSFGELERTLDNLCEALEDDEQALQADTPVPGEAAEAATTSQTTRARKRRRRRGKPDTVILEEILRETGPLYLDNIIPYAIERGVNLQSRNGRHTERKVLRDKLDGSDRFDNAGGNVWGITEQILARRSNGHHTAQDPVPWFGNK